MGKYSTYGTMAKWLKWSSLFILLIPIAIFIMALVNYFKPFGAYLPTVEVLDIILLVLSAIWIVLNIILFFAAGTVRNKTSPAMIRIGLFFSFVLVLAPIIIGLLIYFDVITGNEKAVKIVEICLPLIVTIGYLIGFSCAKRAQLVTE